MMWTAHLIDRDISDISNFKSIVSMLLHVNQSIYLISQMDVID